MIIAVEKIRSVGSLPKSIMPVMTDKRGLKIPTVWIAWIVCLKYTSTSPSPLLLIKKQELGEKILYNRLMEEKVKRLGLELVPKTLPSVRIKLGNNLVLRYRYRITRLMFLAAINKFKFYYSEVENERVLSWSGCQ